MREQEVYKRYTREVCVIGDIQGEQEVCVMGT